MTVIVCVSDGGGMLFNRRRQSKDLEVTLDITRLTADKTLFISDFSAALFSESDASVIAVSDPLESAGCADAVFVEDRKLLPFADKIDELVIYKWNRKYPFDFMLDINPENAGMALFDVLEFKGKSHEKITREIWKKGNKS